MDAKSRRDALAREDGQGKALVTAATLIFAIFIAASVVSGLWSVTAHQASGPAPQKLAGFQLTHTSIGPEAIAQINELHGKPIDVVNAWVAHYQQNGTVWVATAGSEGAVRELLDTMVLRIRDGASPFRDLTQRQFEETPVYTVTDGRQLHLFYQTGPEVVWVAAPAGAEEDFFSDVLRKVG